MRRTAARATAPRTRSSPNWHARPNGVMLRPDAGWAVRTQMTSCCARPGHKRATLQAARLVLGGLVLMIASADHVGAISGLGERPAAAGAERSTGEPIMAIVSLRSQRITIYD